MRDPIGYDGGLNLYAYAGNNPINAVDPDGLNPFELGFGWNVSGAGPEPPRTNPYSYRRVRTQLTGYFSAIEARQAFKSSLPSIQFVGLDANPQELPQGTLQSFPAPGVTNVFVHGRTMSATDGGERPFSIGGGQNDTPEELLGKLRRANVPEGSIIFLCSCNSGTTRPGQSESPAAYIARNHNSIVVAPVNTTLLMTGRGPQIPITMKGIGSVEAFFPNGGRDVIYK